MEAASRRHPPPFDRTLTSPPPSGSCLLAVLGITARRLRTWSTGGAVTVWRPTYGHEERQERICFSGIKLCSVVRYRPIDQPSLVAAVAAYRIIKVYRSVVGLFNECMQDVCLVSAVFKFAFCRRVTGGKAVKHRS